MESNSDPASLNCSFCKDTVFDTSQELFEHLLITHDKEHTLCTFCHRYFYSESEFDAHVSLHKSKRKGYIQCSHCSHNCLSKVTSIQHAIKHCKETFFEDFKTLDQSGNLQKKIPIVENNYMNGFSLFSMSCMYRSKKSGGSTFQCQTCKKQYEDIRKFIKHRNELNECFTEEITTNVNEQEMQETILDLGDVTQKTDDSVDKPTIISVETFPVQCADKDNSSADIPPTHTNEQLGFSETNDTVPHVKFVVKPKGYNKSASTSETKQYITPEDDPIAEFLKIPVKNNITKTITNKNSPTLKTKRTKKPMAEKNIQTKTKRRESEETMISTKKLIKNMFVPTQKESEKEEQHEYVDEVSATEDDDKEQIYLKEVKTLEMLMCEICEQMFSNQHFLNQHKDVHKKYILQNKYFCRFCNYKRFPKVTLLLEHVASKHKTAKLYQCCVCLEDFSKQVYFSKHIKDAHADTSGKFRFDDETGLITFKVCQEDDEEHPLSKSMSQNNTEVVPEENVSNPSQNLDTTDVSVDADVSAANETDIGDDLNEDASKINGCNEIDSIIDAIEDHDVSALTGNENNETADREDGGDDLFVEEHLDIQDIVEQNDEIKTKRSSADVEIQKKNPVVVLEDISKLLKDRMILKRSKRLQMKKQAKLKKKKLRMLKKPIKAKKIVSKIANEKHEVILKKTTSNIVIKVKNPDDINLYCKNTNENMKLRCHFCSKRFKDQVMFHLHIKSHFQEDSFLCICGVRLATQLLFEEHKRKYHKKNDDADIVLIKLNEESYMFVQQSSSLTLQGCLKKVDVPSENPLKFTKLPENTEYMGDVTITRTEDDSNISMLKNKQLSRTRISIKRISSDEAKLKLQNTIKMTAVGEGIKPLSKPFEIKSTYVCPDLSDDMYNGVTHVTKLPSRKRANTNFLLSYDTFEMPDENVDVNKPSRKTYAKRIKPPSSNFDQDIEGVKLVSSNPLAHLMSDNIVYPTPTKYSKKKKDLDYEAIIKRNLSTLMVKSPKKK